MFHRTIPAIAAVVLSCLLVGTAQGPAPPRNLRSDSTHKYFNALVKLPQHDKSYSLRDQSQIYAISQKAGRNDTFTYNPGADTYYDRQDAAKYLRPAGSAFGCPNADQLWVKLQDAPAGTKWLITWDWYYGAEWRATWDGGARPGDLENYKGWQIMAGGAGVWTLSTLFRGAQPSSAYVVSVMDSIRMDPPFAAGLTQREPLHRTGPDTPEQKTYKQKYFQKHSKWMRYWIEIVTDQAPSAFGEWNDTYGVTVGPNTYDEAGRWHMVSLWTADEDRGVQRLLYRVPLDLTEGGAHDDAITAFRFELNTSQSGGFTQDMVAYARNVVVLKNYDLPATAEADKVIFQQPLR